MSPRLGKQSFQIFNFFPDVVIFDKWNSEIVPTTFRKVDCKIIDQSFSKFHMALGRLHRSMQHHYTWAMPEPPVFNTSAILGSYEVGIIVLSSSGCGLIFNFMRFLCLNIIHLDSFMLYSSALRKRAFRRVISRLANPPSKVCLPDY